MRYKYDGDYPPEIQHRLERAAEAAFLLDEEMSEIKEEIQEAQKYYSKKRAKSKMITREVQSCDIQFYLKVIRNQMH